MKVCLLTGATGVVGSSVLARLLHDPETSVLALLRAPSDSAAAARLDNTLTSLQLAERTHARTGRVRAFAGDATLPHLGLPSADFGAVIETCTHIIHCAGAVRMNLPLAEARKAAIDSVLAVLHIARILAEAGRLSKVEIVSTVGVGGREYRHLPEDWVGAHQRFHNTYEQAKAEAEERIREAILSGLPVSVHRPSMVVGDSLTGRISHFQIFYYLVEFLTGRRTGGIFPHFGAARLDVVPVNFVADAIVKSSESRATIGRVLHLCSGPTESVPLQELRMIVHDTLASYGPKLPVAVYLPRSVFRMAIKALRPFVEAKTRSALDTLPIFLDYLNTDQTFENIHTLKWLGEHRITLPRIRDYLPRVLEYYFTHGARH